MHIKTKGVILLEHDFSEYDKYIQLLTYDYGKISVLCKNARRKNSAIANKTRIMCFGEFELFLNKGKYILNDITLTENFFDILNDLEKFALACYFLQVADKLSDTHALDKTFTRIVISALYALRSKPNLLIKAVFELKIMAVSGFLPIISMCGICNTKTDIKSPVFDVFNGYLICGDCVNRLEYANTYSINQTALYAMYHILSCSIDKLYSFKLDENSLHILGIICENFLKAQTELHFKALDFYKSLGGLNEKT